MIAAKRARLWTGSFTCPAHAKRIGPAADTRQSRYRPLHSGLSLPVLPADRLGRGWKRQKRVEKAGSCRVKRQQIIECLRVKRQQSIELLRGRHACRSLASTRGDLVELTARQRYRTFGIRYADGRQQRRCWHQTNNLTMHRTLSIIKR
jgi:hypothetical protein